LLSPRWSENRCPRHAISFSSCFYMYDLIPAGEARLGLQELNLCCRPILKTQGQIQSNHIYQTLYSPVLDGDPSTLTDLAILLKKIQRTDWSMSSGMSDTWPATQKPIVDDTSSLVIPSIIFAHAAKRVLSLESANSALSMLGML